MRLDSGRFVFDSRCMWIRRDFPACARMPTQRPATLNPRLHVARAIEPAAPTQRGEAAVPPQAHRGLKAVTGKPALAKEPGAGDSPVGGFHESSYELQSGLQISESEWPDDVTVPGALGDR